MITSRKCNCSIGGATASVATVACRGMVLGDALCQLLAFCALLSGDALLVLLLCRLILCICQTM